MRGYLMTTTDAYLDALDQLGTLWTLGDPHRRWFPLTNHFSHR